MNKKALLALALGTFALGISEFIMMGILGNISESLGIDVSKGGNLISAYAAGVCIGAPMLLFARKMALKHIMLILAALIAIGNTMMALAPGYTMMLAARFISGLPHGAYFGVSAIIARKLVAPGHEARAVSMVIAGMTVATLCGVPLGTLITELGSWRMAFGIVAVSGLATLTAIKMWVPNVAGLKDTGFWGQFRFLRTGAPWLIFGGVLFGQIGLYCWYSYIDPQMTREAGFTSADMSWIMVLAGLGMVIGNLVAGRLSDRFKPSAIAAAVQGAGIVTMVLFYFLVDYKIAAVLLMMCGTAALFGSGSPLQSSIVYYSKGGELLGGALIQIAYNAGNAIAARLGGIVIAHGYSYSAPAIMGTPIILTGCVLLMILYYKKERVKNLSSGAR